MTDKTLRTLAAGSAVSGGDLFQIRQGADTADKTVTADQVALFAASTASIQTLRKISKNGQTAPFSMTMPANTMVDKIKIENTTGNDPINFSILSIPGFNGLGSDVVLFDGSQTAFSTNSNVPGIYLNGALGVGATITTASASLVLDEDDLIGGMAYHTVSNGDKIILRGQTSQFQNGKFIASGVGVAVILTRTTDYDQSSEISVGQLTRVQQANDPYLIQNTVGPIVIGTDPITFVLAYVNGLDETDLVIGGPNTIMQLDTTLFYGSVLSTAIPGRYSETQDVKLYFTSLNVVGFNGASINVDIMAMDFNAASTTRDAFGSNAGVASGVSIEEIGGSTLHKTIITLTNVHAPLTNYIGVGASGGAKIYTFPNGSIGHVDLMNLTTTLSAAGVTNTWTGNIQLGNAAPTTGDLSNPGDTMIDGGFSPANPAIAGVQHFTNPAGVGTLGNGTDLTTTGGNSPVIYLNQSIADAEESVEITPTDLIYNGTITITWINFGDL